MKKILYKPEEYVVTCPECGTKFSYNLEDVEGVCSYRWVSCPTCEHQIPHSPNKHIINLPNEVPAIPCSNPNPCDDCDFHKKLMSGQTYVGDAPCQWCEHGMGKVTCEAHSCSANSN